MKTTQQIEKTKHSVDCKMAFGRKDASCPRCQELLNGAKPREAWGAYRKRQDARQLEYLREHFQSERHTSGGCGPVCTFGEY